MRVSVSRVRVEATPERVWTGWTDPDHVRRWQDGSVLRTSWAPGTPIRFTSSWEGQQLEQWGSVLEFTPFTQLKYSLFAPRPELEDRPEHYFTMTYSLEAVPGATVLTITQEDPRASGGGPEGDDDSDSSEDNPVLAALRELAEETPGPTPAP